MDFFLDGWLFWLSLNIIPILYEKLRLGITSLGDGEYRGLHLLWTMTRRMMKHTYNRKGNPHQCVVIHRTEPIPRSVAWLLMFDLQNPYFWLQAKKMLQMNSICKKGKTQFTIFCGFMCQHLHDNMQLLTFLHSVDQHLLTSNIKPWQLISKSSTKNCASTWCIDQQLWIPPHCTNIPVKCWPSCDLRVTSWSINC